MNPEPDNAVKLKLRLFDLRHDVVLEFGKYENLMLQDADVKVLVREIKQAFKKAIDRLEIDVTNFKKGE